MNSHLAPEVRERIEGLVQGDPVVLFMKGNRDQPQCGFSAQVVQILDRVLPEYRTVDVLSDPEIREGIKEYSEWPTIPQLYIGGEFQGGCDIVGEMYANGELHQALGLAPPLAGQVTLHVSDDAARLLEEARGQYGGGDVHLGIDARYRHSLAFGPPSPDGVRVEVAGLTIFLDPDSAVRAEGVRIDVRESPQGRGLAIDNPNAPAQEDGDAGDAGGIPQMEVEELAEARRAGVEHRLVDVRTAEERETASIEGSVWLEEDRAALESLDPSTPLVFYCHHGGRSQRAAESFAARGFTNVHNLTGGIDAWSQRVDPDVPRY